MGELSLQRAKIKEFSLSTDTAVNKIIDDGMDGKISRLAKSGLNIKRSN